MTSMVRAMGLGLLLVAGCSGGGASDGSTGGTSGGTGGSSCTTATCNGCCGSDGCQPGTALSACGIGGASCVDCGSSANSCTPNDPQPCECVGGCWDATLLACKTGNTDADCGATFPTNAGTTCVTCRSGKHCTLKDQGDGQVYLCQ